MVVLRCSLTKILTDLHGNHSSGCEPLQGAGNLHTGKFIFTLFILVIFIIVVKVSTDFILS